MRAVLIALILAAGVGAVATGGCFKRPTFSCVNESECTSANGQGTCVGGFCAFADIGCASGQRYGDHSGSLAGQCVPEDVVPPDAPPDTPVIPPDARECYGADLYEVCTHPAPMGSIDLAGAFDTTAVTGDARCVAPPMAWMMAGQPDSCFIVANQITISATLTVTGARPLVLVGASIAVNASIDAGSKLGAGTIGPGASTAVCGVFPRDAIDIATAGASAGGGAGGTFITQGGIGGDAENSDDTGGLPALAIATPMVLRAGCAGQIGGDGPTATGGPPGNGGGAVMLAAGMLTIASGVHIDVSGAGGTGINGGAGGGGGGSGGMLVVFADAASVTGANLLANGGGGASGSNDGGGMGQNGQDPNPDDPTNAANGGTATGGDGGAGFGGATGAQPATNTPNNQAGGGGGGGKGFIQSNVALTGAVVSPTAVP